jgi:hypothetical protein
MWMQVLCVVLVRMSVDRSVGMHMRVAVASTSQGMHDAPRQIREAKTDQQPSCNSAASFLNSLKPIYSKS